MGISMYPLFAIRRLSGRRKVQKRDLVIRTSWQDPLARMKRNVLPEEPICSGGSHGYRGGLQAPQVVLSQVVESRERHAQSETASLSSNPNGAMWPLCNK